MRPKVVLGTLLIGTALIFGFVLAPRFLHPSTATNDITPNSAAGETGPAASLIQQSANVVPVRNDAGNAPALNQPDFAAEVYVKRRIAELENLGRMNDAASRDAILGELQNSNQRIRSAALEAVIQFGDRSVVPRLQELATQTEDAAEKQELLDAADYLNLPSLTEYLAEQKARQAAGLTNPPRSPLRSHRPGSAFRPREASKASQPQPSEN